MKNICVYQHRGNKFHYGEVGASDWYNLHMAFTFERDLREEWWRVEPGDVVVDVGAAYGSYTLTALASGAAAVLAFEPGKDELFSLMCNVVLNSWDSRFMPIPLLVGQGVGVCRYQPPIDGLVEHLKWLPVWLRLLLPRKRNNKPVEDRYATSLDLFLARHELPKLDWIKVDVEGMELAVLRGAENAIANFRPKLFVENHVGIVPGVVEEIQEFMKRFDGYSEENRNDPTAANDNWSLWTPEEKAAKS